MRSILQRLVALAAVASMVCLTSQYVHAQGVVPIEDHLDNPLDFHRGYEARTHNKKKYHHGHHRQRHQNRHPKIRDHKHQHNIHKGHRPHRKIHKLCRNSTQLRLVCNGVVVDRMTCADPRSIVSMVERSEQIYALSNRKRKCCPRKITNIAMSLPCSRNLPANCTSQLQSESFEGESTIDAKDDPEDPGGDDDDTKSTFEAESHRRRKGLRRKHGHHHQHQHKKDHHQKQSKKYKKHRKDQLHPYKDLCVATGDNCGSKLFGCGFSHNTLYTCYAVGEEPVVKQANSSMCNGNDGEGGGGSGGEGGEGNELKGCTCNSTTPVCGKSLPESCRAEPNVIYHCKGGRGSKPEKLSTCEDGTRCIKKDAPVGAACAHEDCQCQGDNEVCSNTFPDNCGFEKNSVYKCTKGGSPELVKKCDASHSCITTLDKSTCTSNDCKCKNDLVVCGSSYPTLCGFDKTSIYKCAGGKGSDPSSPQKCATGQCLAVDGVDRCKPEPPADCKCMSKNSICGKHYPPGCSLDTDTLFSCSSPGADPVANIKCPEGCETLPSGADACKPKVDDDTCKCKDGDSVCGSVFADSCGFDKSSLYQCTSGKGADPVPYQKCATGCFDVTGADGCGPEPPPDCKCRGNTTICGSRYPPDCKMDNSTLYICPGSGAVPFPGPKCESACEVKPTGGDECKDTCVCSNRAVQCGSALPSNCSFSAMDVYDCTAGIGTKPLLMKKCVQGLTCIQHSDCGDDCGGVDCTCIGNATICSITFPDSCNFEKNSVIQCTENGIPVKVKTCETGMECVADSNGATCVPADCKCPIDGAVCGGIFPSMCRIKNVAMYICVKGQTPVLVKDLLPATCYASVVKAKTASLFDAKNADDLVIDPCLCPSPGFMCGSSFDKSCQKDAGMLYECSRPYAQPAVRRTCPDNKCTVAPGDDHCGDSVTPPIPPENDTLCRCQNSIAVCGSKIPEPCASLLNVTTIHSKQIFTCPDGEGSIYKKGEECDGDSFCSTQLGPIGPICMPVCGCDSTETKCASDFSPTCKLPPQGIFKCSVDGMVEEVEVCQGSDVCVRTDLGVKCIPPECVCKDDALHCGSFFNDTCNIAADALYQCKNGEAAQYIENCLPGMCSSNIPPLTFTSAGILEAKQLESNPKCVKQCECKYQRPVCATTFDVACGLDSKDLITCTGMGAMPIVNQTCTLKCNEQDNWDDCALDPCACSKAGKVCSDAFPSTCKYDANTIYTCEGDRKLPTKNDTCTSDQFCATVPEPFGALCKPLCNCTGTATQCSSAFKATCKLPAQGIYKCTDAGTVEKVGDCQAGDVCVKDDTSAKCIHPECVCQGDRPYCGSFFNETCKMDPDTLYDCQTGKAAQVIESCLPGVCATNIPTTIDSFAQKFEAQLVPVPKCVKQCECKYNTTVCGSTFDKVCGFNSTDLISCTGMGSAPTMNQTCTLKCVVKDGLSDCALDPCACTKTGKVCSSIFPLSCNYEANTIQSCPGDRQFPTKSDTCSADKYCATQPEPAEPICKMLCNCSGTATECSTAFNPVCKLPPQGVFKCSATGIVEEVVVCQGMEVCVKAGTAAMCIPPECICKDDGTHCGSFFNDTCKLPPDGLFQCKSGQAPISTQDCLPGICSSNIKPAATSVSSVEIFEEEGEEVSKCIKQCECKGIGAVCASEFDTACKYPATDLLTCTGVGATPTTNQTCTLKCDVKAGAHDCVVDPCACTKTGKVCSNAFPSTCGLDANTIYTCEGDRKLPTKNDTCTSDQFCATVPDPIGALCKPFCNCTGTATQCSTAFDAMCKLPAQGVYRCTAEGAVEKVEDCTGNNVCIKTGDTAKCTPPECICTDDAVHCGSVQPDACKLALETLYQCKKEELPSIAKDCQPGVCLAGVHTLTPSTPDNCVGQCECRDVGPVCGSVFDSACKFDSKELLLCSAISAIPTKNQSCTLRCDVKAGADDCAIDPCACTKSGKVCSDAFPSSCGLDSNTIYTCEGDRKLPTKNDTCTLDQFCATVADPIGALCKPLCNCTGTATQCSASFKAACKLPVQGVYKCTADGAVERVEDCVGTNVCVKVADSAKCIPPECVCKDDTTHCGSTFNATCGHVANTLYQCKNGEAATIVKTCQPGVCSASIQAATVADPDKCVGQCECKGSEKVCASVFDTACNFNMTDVMSCSGIGATPTLDQTCTLMCDVKANADDCAVDPCACTKSGKVCSDSFPSTCGLDADSIFTCEGDRKLPKKDSACTSDQFCATVPDPVGALCKPLCNCTGTVTQCSSAFKAACKLPVQGVYKCTDAGAVEMVEDCIGANVCIPDAAIAKCVPPECVCKDDTAHCGSTFPATCKLDADTLYQCKNGALATVSASCKPGVCLSDKCIGQCECKGSGAVCASEFDPVCNFTATDLMSCTGAGAKPAMNQTCTLKCDVKDGVDDCAPDPCACTQSGSVCSGIFPSSCGYLNNTIYSCNADRKIPTKTSTCSDDQYCATQPAPVGPICKPVCNCTGTATQCSTAFDPICKLPVQGVFKCSATGTVEEVEVCKGADICVKAGDAAKCTPLECICKDDAVHCGSFFNSTCRLALDTLYQCKSSEPASVIEDCKPGVCSSNIEVPTIAPTQVQIFEKEATGDPPKCIKQCECKEMGMVCASSFDGACKFEALDLMACTDIGATPTKSETCTLKCNIDHGASGCALDPCACTKAGKVCSDIFPSMCGLDANTIYTCEGDRKLPIKNDTCTSDQFCATVPDPIGALCKPLCNCTGTATQCSASFKAACKLPVQGVYKCTADGAVERVEDCVGTNVCVKVADSAKCIPPECVCKDDTTHCGSTFNATCGLVTDTLYQCKNGEAATIVKTCQPGVCSASIQVATVADPDKCVGQCECKGSEKVCASVFDTACNFNVTDLMSCSGIGATPTLDQTCTLMCDVKAGADDCAVDPCACTKASKVCSDTFPSTCGLVANTMYSCEGDRKMPTKNDTCTSDQFCAMVPDPVGALCKPLCNCTGTATQCSSSFKAACKLPLQGVYKCTADGAVEKVEDCIGTNVCVKAGSSASCIPPECVCKDDALHCGSTFNATCKLGTDILYQCKNGEAATEAEICSPGICSASIQASTAEAPDKCVGQCECKGSEKVCASAFDTACKFSSLDLMSCMEMGGTPTKDQTCTLKCDVRAGADDCAEDPCACSKAGKVCSNTFPSTCGLDANTIYTCEGDRKLPTKNDTCTSDQFCAAVLDPVGALCKPLCNCTGTATQCSASFNAACKLPVQGVYKCTADGAVERVEDCVGTNVCVKVADNAKCIPPECVCKDDTTHCGSTFSATCGHVTNTLYQCKNGEAATIVKTCQPGVCSASIQAATVADPDKCVGQCECKGSEKVCASVFDTACNFNVTDLMSCSGIGATPTLDQTCTLKCDVKAGADDCAVDPCACTTSGKVCSSTFPADCIYEANSILSCPGDRQLPTKIDSCFGDQYCATLLDPLNPTCKPLCNCTGTATQCSTEFKAVCRLPAQGAFRCSANGTVEEVEVCQGTDICAKSGDSAKCLPSQCTCTDDATSCGYVYPSACKLMSETLYKCTTGEFPAVAQDCLPGVCLPGSTPTTPGTPDRCVGQCECKDVGLVCGSVFDSACKFDSKELLLCSAISAIPTKNQSCTLRCDVKAGADDCAIDPCACTKSGKVCSDAFPSSCGLDSNTVYTCEGDRKLPTKNDTCTLDQFCATVADPIGALCKPLCNCTGTATQCSASFNAACKLPVQGVYKCTADGAVERVEDCVGTNVCVKVADSAKCIPPECVCKDDTTHCGSTFNATCGLVTDTLYQCKNGEAATIVKTCQPGVCSASIQAATVADPDKCVGQCECKGSEKVCASVFDTACNFNVTDLMSCTEMGATPTKNQTCSVTCDVIDGDDACLDPCACPRTGSQCGSAFPSSLCNYDPNGLYLCNAKGAQPTFVSACPITSVCTVVPAGADTCGSTNSGTTLVCSCQGSGNTCSDKYPSNCNVTSNTFITCPEHVSTACPNGCANGNCTSGCTCSTAGAKCGSSFAPSCNLIPNSLYSCTAGSAPVYQQPCGEQACARSSSGDICQDPCLCRDTRNVCGSTFATSCELNETSLYQCPTVGQKPVVVQKCPSICLYTSPDHVCKPECTAPITAATTQIQQILAKMLFKNPEGLSTAPLGTSTNIVLFPGLGPAPLGTSMNMVLFPALTNYLTTASADLTVVKDDPTKLASTALMLNLTVDMIRGVLDTAKAQLPPERRTSIDPLIAELTTLQPMLTAIVQCAGGTPVKDCTVGPYALYSSLYTASIARMKALAVGTRATPINDILQKMGQINPAINDLVAQTAFDDASYSDISDLLDMLNRAAGEVYKCEGQSSRYPTDNCQNINERAKNYLTYAFQYFKTIYAQASLGFITDPLLDTIQTMTNSFLTATNIDITGISNIIAEMLYLLTFIAPTTIQPQLMMLVDKIRAIQATAQECTGNKDCMGPISFVVSVLKVPAALVDSLLFCGFFNPVGCVPGTALRALIDLLGNLAKGVVGVTVPVVQAAVTALKTAVCLVPIVNVLCPIAEYANDALTRISTCIAG